MPVSMRNFRVAGLGCVLILGALGSISCGSGKKVDATSAPPASAAPPSVAVTKATRARLAQEITVSAELVPYQEIDVYAKESGYVKELNVDYGSRVKKDEIMAVLEDPELEIQLQQDDSAIKAAEDQVRRLGLEVKSIEARQNVTHDYYTRIAMVAKSKPGLVAQQEVDEAQGKDLTAQADLEAAKANQTAAQDQAQAARAKRERDEVLFGYTKITAPFAGVVTQRYANYGTLMQAGTNSSTQALPLVRLSEDDKFRLVIPVPESDVQYVRVGNPVQVMVPSLNRTFPGTVARFAVDVREDTRTMHTEVDVPNPDHALLPGLYADATIQLQEKDGALAVPIQALDQETDKTTVDVIDANNQVAIRTVRTGIETDSEVEILSGVKAGEWVVIGDRSGLKAGQTVAPKPTEAAEFQDQ